MNAACSAKKMPLKEYVVKSKRRGGERKGEGREAGGRGQLPIIRSR